jgi:hypothetical protein
VRFIEVKSLVILKRKDMVMELSPIDRVGSLKGNGTMIVDKVKVLSNFMT